MEEWGSKGGTEKKEKAERRENETREKKTGRDVVVAGKSNFEVVVN